MNIWCRAAWNFLDIEVCLIWYPLEWTQAVANANLYFPAKFSIFFIVLIFTLEIVVQGSRINASSRYNSNLDFLKVTFTQITWT